MKNARIISLALVSLMLLFCFVGCGNATGGGDVTTGTPVTATVSVVDLSGKTLIDGREVSINADEEATALLALERACYAEDVAMVKSEDETTVDSIGGIASTDDVPGYWAWTLNGKAVTNGRAGTTTIKDGAKLIFTFTTLAK